jgi:hypothetical protein
MVKMSKELRDAVVGIFAIGVCFGAIGTVTIAYPPGAETPLWVYAVMWTVVPAGSTIGGQWIGRRLYGKTIAESVLAVQKMQSERIDANFRDLQMLRDVMVKTWGEFRAEKDAMERAVKALGESLECDRPCDPKSNIN